MKTTHGFSNDTVSRRKISLEPLIKQIELFKEVTSITPGIESKAAYQAYNHVLALINIFVRDNLNKI